VEYADLKIFIPTRIKQTHSLPGPNKEMPMSKLCKIDKCMKMFSITPPIYVPQGGDIRYIEKKIH
jgi:hypothetical protein